MNQEEMKQMEINNEIEKNGNFYLLYEDKNENEYSSDLIEQIEKFSCGQEKTTDIGSQWKKLKNKNSLKLNNVKLVNLLLNNLVKHIKINILFVLNQLYFIYLNDCLHPIFPILIRLSHNKEFPSLAINMKPNLFL